MRRFNFLRFAAKSKKTPFLDCVFYREIAQNAVFGAPTEGPKTRSCAKLGSQWLTRFEAKPRETDRDRRTCFRRRCPALARREPRTDGRATTACVKTRGGDAKKGPSRNPRMETQRARRRSAGRGQALKRKLGSTHTGEARERAATTSSYRFSTAAKTDRFFRVRKRHRHDGAPRNRDGGWGGDSTGSTRSSGQRGPSAMDSARDLMR